jgi:hypothetical protein
MAAPVWLWVSTAHAACSRTRLSSPRLARLSAPREGELYRRPCEARFIELAIAARLADRREDLARYPAAEAMRNRARRHRLAAAEDGGVKAGFGDDEERLCSASLAGMTIS